MLSIVHVGSVTVNKVIYLYSGMVMRLADGKGSYEGRIEVHNNNAWGTVCSEGFDAKDAEVTCKYLGHPGVEEIYDNGKFKTKGTPIWMSYLKCTGEEYSPFECVQAPIGNHDCSHNQDVAIRCSSKFIVTVTSSCVSLYRGCTIG